MYAYRVIVSTLVVLLMVGLVFSALNSKGSGKSGAMIIFVVLGAALVAIWG